MVFLLWNMGEKFGVEKRRRTPGIEPDGNAKAIIYTPTIRFSTG